ncbi:MAG: hypothetical protein IMY85_01440 [Chloroflexi bacterium]|nr:hypothetical protein [Chloroflexota bacterium]
MTTIDTRNPEKTAWKTIIPGNGDAVECIKLVNNQFIVIYLHDAYHQVRRFDTACNFLGEIAFPMTGTNRYICFLSQST